MTIDDLEPMPKFVGYNPSDFVPGDDLPKWILRYNTEPIARDTSLGRYLRAFILDDFATIKDFVKYAKPDFSVLILLDGRAFPSEEHVSFVMQKIREYQNEQRPNN